MGQTESHALEWPHRPSDSVADIAQEAISVLLLSAESNGGIKGIGYWQVANAYTAILHHDLWSRTFPAASARGSSPSSRLEHKNISLVRHQIDAILRSHHHCINEFNDDTMWWGHTLLLLNAATGAEVYLQHSVRIFQQVSRFVLPHQSVVGQETSKLRGGVLWKTTSDCRDANSITTGLWAEFCAHLATLDQNIPLSRAALLNASIDGINFIIANLYREGDNVVLDTLKIDTGEIIDWTFTYTTGQLIAAIVALHRAGSMASIPLKPQLSETPMQQDWNAVDKFFALAVSLARSAMARDQWVEGLNSKTPGVLSEYSAYGPERHKASENNDAVGFKSVLIRSLTKLFVYTGELQAKGNEVVIHGVGRTDLQDLSLEISTFIRRTYQSLLDDCSNDIGQYGPWWAGPMDISTAHSQMAVIDVMAAMKLMTPEP